MFKASFFSALILAVFASLSVKAQSTVDAGISTHNYKHPNKAAKAKAAKGDGVRVATIGTIDSYYKRQNRGTINTTPKYAPRPAALVITRTFKDEGNDLNPLLSPRNYKTPTNVEVKRTWEIAAFPDTTDSTYCPTVD